MALDRYTIAVVSNSGPRARKSWRRVLRVPGPLFNIKSILDLTLLGSMTAEVLSRGAGQWGEVLEWFRISAGSFLK